MSDVVSAGPGILIKKVVGFEPIVNVPVNNI